MAVISLDLVSIRRAQADDQEVLRKLYDVEIDLSASGKFFTYLAEDTEPFGFVSAGEGEIIALYIKPEYRRKGMGSKLLVRGLSILKLRGFESALCWLAEGDTPALEILLSLKFKADGSERLTNTRDGATRTEKGYRLGLSEYF